LVRVGGTARRGAKSNNSGGQTALSAQLRPKFWAALIVAFLFFS